jgi:uncharacterized membrane protein
VSGGTLSGATGPDRAVGDQGRSATAEAAANSVDRLTFFSDAVVAIAMTLLALDLPVPNVDSGPRLAEFVSDHLGEYLAFLVSFLVIAAYWRAHHQLYRYVMDASPPVVTLNIYWLLTVVVTPYATRVLYGGQDISHSDFPWRFSFYALVQAFAALTFFLAQRYLEQEGLLAPGTPPGVLQRGRIRNLVLMSLFGVSIPLAFAIHGWAFVAWGLIPVARRLVDALVQRRHARAG